ncbi:hypothetical protein AZA_49062 [Nitrospirillum viridazoti Y2]|nr:hypothetical protein AZA_49062 [Nitrospirillum amazonense Y2]
MAPAPGSVLQIGSDAEVEARVLAAEIGRQPPAGFTDACRTRGPGMVRVGGLGMPEQRRRPGGAREKDKKRAERGFVRKGER